MSTYKPLLDAGVPSPHDPADVPKALSHFAGAVDQALDAQREDVDRLAKDLDGAGIRAEVKKHHVIWGILVEGETL